MQLKITYLFCFLFLTFLDSYGQKLLKHFNVDNGLLSSEAYHVIQDHKGFIWIATDEGVSKYDGYSFKHFNNKNGLPESTVLELFEDYKKRLWFVTITNELVYLENDSIHIYPYIDSIKRRNRQNYYPIKKSFYVDSSDNIYLGIYYNEIFKITSRGETTVFNPQHTSVNAISKVENKYIFTSRKNKEKRINIKNPYLEDSVYNLPSEVYACRSIVEKHNNRLYYTDFNQMVVFDPQGNVSYHQFDHDILWLSVDNQNNLWFGFHHGGAVVFEDSSFTRKKYHVLPNQSITSVLLDNEGSYWFSTLYNGVYMYSPMSFQNFDQSSGIKKLPITQLAFFNEYMLLAGAGSQLYYYKDGNFFSKNLKLKRSPTVCKYLDVVGDSLFISYTRNGNFLIYKNRIEKLPIGNYATEILPFKDGFYYFHRREIIYIRNGKVERKIISKLYSEVYDLIQYNDSLIWLGTNNGLMELNLNSGFPSQLALNPLLNSRVNAITTSKDTTIWIFTNDNGIFSVKNEIVKRFYPDILKEKIISCQIDLDSLLFVGTNEGVIRFDKHSDSLIVKNAYRIGSANGILSNDIFDLGYKKGHIYAATSMGVSSFPINLNFTSSPLYIKSFKINGKDTVIRKQYHLAFNENYIDFEFFVLNYQRNEPLTYMYKLEGVDRKWRQTHEQKVQYSALLPGEYVFKIKAVNSFGMLNEMPATINITIDKAYYNTFWFRALVLLMFLILVSGVFFIILRVKLKEARKRHMVEGELNKSRQQALSAQMNPHFIYNSLNSVQSYILKNEKIKASEYLSKLGRLMKDILNNSQNQLITLKDEFNALEKYMEMEQLRFKNLFQFKVNVCINLDIDEIKVPPLIIQPFVENAIHHGLRLRKENGTLLVDAKTIDAKLQITIEDNGVGIENAKRYNSENRKNHKSFGTEITHKRLKLLEEMNKEKVTLSISEAYPEDKYFPGTRVKLIINLT